MIPLHVICLIFCATQVLGTFLPSIDDTLHEYETNCARVSGATHSAIEIARNTKMLANTARLNAFAMCMLQQFNVMDSNGIVNPDVMSYSIISNVPNATAGISQQCISKRGIDAVNTARMIMNCYLRANQMVLALSRRDCT
ncbi:uncharacterized protein LOC103317773 isoform X2 [Nasonia vitripennis]|uniref:Uncharacterized protein n=1 Tax=Nasonia vitripennis TaxID=7425 RepID=A0A7M7TAC5_NASVI|nr:uncharacterized protein LOC103317773 isoform X2 [Nasonia vitripennis]